MDKALWDKLAAAGGIAGVVLFVVGLLVMGSPPGVDEDPAAVADFFADNRGQVLWGTFIGGLGALAIIWFVSALGAAMRNAGEGRLAAALGLAFAITFAIGSVAVLLRAGLAFNVAPGGDAEVAWALYQTSVTLDTFSAVIAAGVYASVAGAALRTGFLPRWWGWISGLTALYSIVAATGWARDGFWSPDGIGLVSFLVFLAWILVSSILLTARTREAPAGQPAPSL
ncbi:MAG TPA: DUF4386 family protein [Gaiellaceae bacterium]|nr:DUF4386 family protein [Gaiellaceae bacterium]